MTSPIPESRNREAVLGAVRQALRHAASNPAERDAPAQASRSALEFPARGLFSIPAPGEAGVQRFLEECAANRTEVIQIGSEEQASAVLIKILESVMGLEPNPAAIPGAGPAGNTAVVAAGSEGLYVQDAPALRRLLSPLLENLSGRILWSSATACEENRAAGLTLAEALVAQTGSVIVGSDCGGRAASVLPELHIVYARASQIAPDLETALASLGGASANESLFDRASMASVVTGPSRTADIEKLLVLGAHGPRRLIVLLCMNA